ncbi:brain and acute leukemia cytoplasmic protein-like [Erythrolamprus reginae]|uniref:brain and acute leukemia cytoplasmic protein-like n=1 Tax=Erythrolamprus reginae TaxID=121349 RepID=UPI00396C9C42
MGCSRSRSDTIELRYYESLTESTWLTNMDTEPQQQPLPAASPESADTKASFKKSPSETGKRRTGGPPCHRGAATEQCRCSGLPPSPCPATPQLSQSQTGIL